MAKKNEKSANPPATTEKGSKKKGKTVNEFDEIVDTYPHITGPDRDWIIRMLGKINAAPRTEQKFAELISTVEKRIAKYEKEGKEMDPLVPLMLEQLRVFANTTDSRKKQEFINYENKFDIVSSV